MTGNRERQQMRRWGRNRGNGLDQGDWPARPARFVRQFGLTWPRPSDRAVPSVLLALAVCAAVLCQTGCGGFSDQRYPAAVPAYDSASFAGTPLPAAYDGRQDGRTSPVKDQGDLGTCWAFASLMALESSLLPDEAWDFSEDHMSNHPAFRLGQENGGDYVMSMAYLLSWQGPVREEDDPYGDGISPAGLEAVRHVQEIQLLPAGDRDAIKQAVYRCGGVQSALYTDLTDGESRSDYFNREKQAYCCPVSRAPNHDIVIVGWDDAYPAENFSSPVPGDGAYLCENSWGTEFGADGFFYVSYYDANIGTTNLLYSSVQPPDNYDHLYQSDLCGWVGQIGYGSDTAWAVNVYRAAGRERLQAVGFYATAPQTAYEVYVKTGMPETAADLDLTGEKLLASGTLSNAGFYTVPLKKPVRLRPGGRYGVIVKLTSPGTVHPIAIEYDPGDGKWVVDLDDGEGYISVDGKKWQRTETTQRCNLCLKAYTTED